MRGPTFGPQPFVAVRSSKAGDHADRLFCWAVQEKDSGRARVDATQYGRWHLSRASETGELSLVKPSRRPTAGYVCALGLIVVHFPLKAGGADNQAETFHPARGGGLPRIRVAPDQRGFQDERGRRFVPWGVNYFRPGTGWAPQVWKQFDPEATRRDFALMRELGINCVRVFLTYGSFCHEPPQLSSEGLAKFDRFLQLAEEAGIYVHPTGPDHWEGLPSWAREDRYADEKVLQALEAFWHQLASRYRGRSVLFAYDLLNEPEIPWDTPALRDRWQLWLARRYGSLERLAAAWGATGTNLGWGRIPVPAREDCPGCPRLLDFQMFREDVAEEWVRRQVRAIRAADPEALVTVGLIQWSVPVALAGPWHYSGFRPQRIAPHLDFLSVHFYPLARGFYTYRAEDEEWNLTYLQVVLQEVARPGKTVMLGEFGWYGGGALSFADHPPATEEQQARWGRLLVETSRPWVSGWLHWGLYDHPEARDVTQRIGLLDAEGRRKAWGQTFRELGHRLRAQDQKPPPPSTLPCLDWSACLTSARAGRDHLQTCMSQRRATPP